MEIKWPNVEFIQVKFICDADFLHENNWQCSKFQIDVISKWTQFSFARKAVYVDFENE